MYSKYLPFVRTLVSGLVASGSVQEVLVAGWIDEVARWNRRLDLTAARGDRELVDLMLADAVVLASRLVSGVSVVDVGSGAGAPGLPLAALRPDLRLTLVEPMQKRAALLRIVAGRWRNAPLRDGGPQVAVVQSRGEQLVADGQRFDVALSRATLQPEEWLRLGAALTAEAGEVWVLLAREPVPQLSGWSAVEEIAYSWPLTAASRRAVRFQRSTR
jgi:16S rRNA (guanine527-N7)-methyltransferase